MRDASTLLLTLEFPAADAANFTVGQAAQVTLDGTFAVSYTHLCGILNNRVSPLAGGQNDFGGK